MKNKLTVKRNIILEKDLYPMKTAPTTERTVLLLKSPCFALN